MPIAAKSLPRGSAKPLQDASILTGPRQVGKTTLLLELAEQFGDQAVYAAGDDPNAALPGFWERCWAETEARAKRGTALLLLDEVHQVPDWAAKLKGNWDRIRRRHIPIHVIATGSSTLRVPPARARVWPAALSV